MTVALPSHLEERSEGARSSIPLLATAYLCAVALAAIAATVPAVNALRPGTSAWTNFVILTVAAAVAQLFKVVTTRNQSMHPALVFAVAAVLLLPPGLVALLAIAIHVPEWLKVRYPWFIQTFNISNWLASALAAWAIAYGVLHAGIADHELRLALAGLAATVVFVSLNHLLLAIMLKLARGHSFEQSGLFKFESLSADFVITALGTAVAVLWRLDPWVAPAALAPLLLIHRSLSVPTLQEQARVDPKTGLFNARHFGEVLTEELARAQRFGRPLSLVMADLDLLREINNSYGHLAGDSVLRGVAELFREHLRNYDVPARFGGEEFAIVLPETATEDALQIAERIRQSVAMAEFTANTSSEPIRVTISIGIATFPDDATDAHGLVHQADLAVYRAKLQGRNRVLAATSEPLALPEQRTLRSATLLDETEITAASAPGRPPQAERRHPRPHAISGPWFRRMSLPLGLLVAAVVVSGVGGGIAGLVLGHYHDIVGLVAIAIVVAAGQALAVELDESTISVAAVGALAGAALYGTEAALPLAIASASVAWSATRAPLHQVLFNVGSLSLASLAAAGVFAVHPVAHLWRAELVGLGVVAGAAYYVVNMGLLSLVLAIEGRKGWRSEWQERFRWLAVHYLTYGFVAAVIRIAYDAAGLYALAAFAVPLFVMRQTQEAYVAHARRSADKLRSAAETIQAQNASLEEANRALRDRSTVAMESLSATVDARDRHTAGHSRRVRDLALAIGNELGLSHAELDLLAHAALFHDIGKLAVGDAILLKPAALNGDEWVVMKRHSLEGARIIDRLGFLADAVPAIRHHHERYDGTGYPDQLAGEEIPLGARAIHVADALDSMLTNRVYRKAIPLSAAIEELDRHAGAQFCPRCVEAVKRVAPKIRLAEDSSRWHLRVAS